MGWGAAMALAEETGFSPEDAHDMLYGHRPRPKCPICGKKCGGKEGVKMHMLAVHKSERLKSRVEAALRAIAEARHD